MSFFLQFGCGFNMNQFNVKFFTNKEVSVQIQIKKKLNKKRRNNFILGEGE